MISSDNPATSFANHDTDFTVGHYRQLLRIARQKWPLVSYDAIPFGQRFLLWRHDCDYSLNRALALARIEHSEGIQATYFINPHSEFYNPLERGQLDILRQIQGMGHYLALHFDGMFFDTKDQFDLVRQLENEACLFEAFLGQRPIAFSFHNPSQFHLSCEAESYANMVNCYSRRFKEEVAYCSDSNGYWRFQRLYDVLYRGDHNMMQVLTHPGWWQDQPMSPREKVFRSVYGRSEATLRFFYKAIEDGGRENPSGVRPELNFLRSVDSRLFALFDFLWNEGRYLSLFFELWSLHELQIERLLRAKLTTAWSVPVSEVDSLFTSNHLAANSRCLFELLFEIDWLDAAGISCQIHKDLLHLRNQITHVSLSIQSRDLELGCLCLCEVMSQLAIWGLKQPFKYDGLAHFDSVEMKTFVGADRSYADAPEELDTVAPESSQKCWHVLKEELANLLK